MIDFTIVFINIQNWHNNHKIDTAIVGTFLNCLIDGSEGPKIDFTNAFCRYSSPWLTKAKTFML